VSKHRFWSFDFLERPRQTRLAHLLMSTSASDSAALRRTRCHTPANLTELGALARERDIEITSLHAPCPIAVDERGKSGSLG